MTDLENVVFPALKDRVVIITGAGQGIGRIFAKSFAMAGARAVIAELNEQKAAAVSEEIMRAGGQALAVTTDVADDASIKEMVGVVEDEYGRIDVLINNAGIFSTLEMRPFDQIPLEEWERVLRVNLTGPFLCARAVLPAMRRAKWGRIINVASGAVRLGRPNYLHYIATKAALSGMSLSMARELGGDNITVNAILPGATFTEIERKTVTPEQKERIIAMQCVPRAEVPEDLVGATLFLASEASAFVTPTVTIIAPGSMGAGIGRRLTENKVNVLTSLAGRTEASAKRARAAGMQAADDRALTDADFLMSIVPPGDAPALARRLAPTLTAANKKPIYVECNAVSPPTMLKIAEVIAATGCSFVGAGIIGPPPKPGSSNTRIYASGPAANDLAKLNDYGLIVRVLKGPLTAASALKMSYAGITKGFTALGTAMMLAATRGGSAEALRAELAESRPDLLAYLTRQVPDMYGKAYRWVAELDEIASFVGTDYPEHEMLAAAARLYERIAEDVTGGKKETGELDRFLKS
jgi:putative dehydrogenase